MFDLLLLILFVLLIINLLKVYENYDSRIELSEELYYKFKDCCEYHRYMQNSGCYDDDLDSDGSYRAWENRIKLIERELPKYLRDKIGTFPTREFEERYKIRRN